MFTMLSNFIEFPKLYEYDEAPTLSLNVFRYYSENS